MRYHVDADARSKRYCKSIDQAISHAKKFVYMDSETEIRVRNELERVQVAEYNYGFAHCFITPVAE